MSHFLPEDTNNLTELTVEQAELLVRRDEPILLNVLTSLSPEVAAVLARCSDYLALDGLNENGGGREFPVAGGETVHIGRAAEGASQKTWSSCLARFPPSPTAGIRRSPVPCTRAPTI